MPSHDKQPQFAHYKVEQREHHPVTVQINGNEGNKKMGKFTGLMEGTWRQQSPSEKVGSDSLPGHVKAGYLEMDDRIR